jgi:hypothetical protein
VRVKKRVRWLLQGVDAIEQEMAAIDEAMSPWRPPADRRRAILSGPAMTP